jgi:hypothetical protein
MLPDWPDLKEEIVRAFMRHAAVRVRQRSVAGMVVAVRGAWTFYSAKRRKY